MPDISKINALAIGSVAKVDGLAKASILDIDGVAVPAGVAPPLDTYTGASAAFSVRLLRTAYTGDIMRVRRASDNVEADVGFDGGELKLTSPISNTSDALSYTDFADFVDHTGTPTNAFVRWWYDQSGNANDAGQSTGNSQPQIYSASTGLITNNNGNVAIEFIRQSSTSLSTPSFDMVDTGWFCVTVAERRSTTGDQMYIDSFGNVGDRTGRIFHHPGSGLLTSGGGASVTGSISTNVTYLWTSENTLTNLSLYINGTSAGTDSITSQGDDQNGFDIGKRKGLAEGYSNTYSSEIIYWRSNQSSNRTDIEDNLNGHFQIF